MFEERCGPMQRYFLANHDFEDERVVIKGDDAHHIIRVMRMVAGDEVICCNEKDESALCTIEDVSSGDVVLNVTKWLDERKELPVSVTIANGLPKGDKLELIIQKGTELGAAKFIPFIAGRSIVKWDEKKGKKKLERWQKIAKEAAEQSHRTKCPVVTEPLTVQKLIEEAKNYDRIIVAYEEEAKAGESANLYKSLSSLTKGQSVLVVIGPEGGLTEKEVQLLKENGSVICGFGPRILRTETASMYVLAAVSYQTELME